MVTRSILRPVLRPVTRAVSDTIRGFNPRSLFASGEQGAWYDPSDFSTLFQNAAGTTPVTAVGQPVGLMLDKRLGLALGEELKSTGAIGLVGAATAATYNTTTGAGSVTRVSAANQSFVTFAVPTAKFYKMTISAAGADIYVNYGDYSIIPWATIAAGTSSTILIPALAGHTSLTIRCASAGTATFVVNSVREIAGNHAYQTTSASRPTVEARVNLLTKTDAGFSTAPWQGVGTTASGSRITASAVNSIHIRYHPTTHIPDVPVRYRVQVAKKVGFGFFQLCFTNPNRVKCTVNLETGEFVVSKLGGADAVVTVTDTGTGRWEVTLTGSNSAATSSGYFNMGPTTSLGGAVNSWGEPVFTGAGEYMDVYEPDLRLASDSAYPYQRVDTATDYVDVGAPRYLSFDGTDDGMATPSINFTGTDKVTVWAGAKSNSAAANSLLFELSNTFGAGNPGSMAVLWPRLPYAVNFGLAGTVAASRSTSASADTALRVISCAFDISASATVDEVKPRANGAAPSLLTIDPGPAGTGNFGNYPLYIGRRGGTSLPFNGRIYQLIIRGAASNDGQIAAGEAWCNSKARAY